MWVLLRIDVDFATDEFQARYESRVTMRSIRLRAVARKSARTLQTGFDRVAVQKPDEWRKPRVEQTVLTEFRAELWLG
jgi:hypothetical protein